ncbi:hypothetical protein PIROE2DRAFT_16246, partial [Piromyces sp. E2]
VEVGICSINEFIYSFRDSVDSPFPYITSQTTVNALEKMKEMKKKIGSDYIFKSDEGLVFNLLSTGNFLFFKFWYIPNMPYAHTVMPGRKEGLSGSTVGGHNFGINKYSNITKRNEVITAFKYLTSKDIQKKYIAMDNYYTPILSLYDDEEVCSVVDCNYYKRIQLTTRPTTASNDYLNYSEIYMKYVYEFLYGNKTAIEVLKKIENLTKIYNYSIKTDDSIYYGVRQFLCIFYSLSSYSLFYCLRIIWAIFGRNEGKSVTKKINKYLDIIDKNNNINNENNSGISNSTSNRSVHPSTNNVGKTSAIASMSRKIIHYHYRTGIEHELSNDQSSEFSYALNSTIN